jgi:hypothetical protein
MKWKWVFLAPLIVVGIVLFAALGGAVVMLLWNWLLPPLFGWPQITFWQGLGLLALCRILFGGWASHGGGHRSGVRRRVCGRIDERLAERLDEMTPEERERLRQRLRDRFGFHDRPAGTTGE